MGTAGGNEYRRTGRGYYPSGNNVESNPATGQKCRCESRKRGRTDGKTSRRSKGDLMSILIYAEHDNNHLKSETHKLVTAASQLGDDIHILVAVSDCSAVAEQAASIAGVKRVMLADNTAYAHQLAENTADLVLDIAGGYSHILAAATTTGKNFMPRVAALLDVVQLSDIIGIESADTFVRPIYAGNAIATIQSSDAVITL